MASKKKGGAKDGDDKAQKEMNEILAGQISVLKWKIGKNYIAMEQEKSDKSRSGQNECKQRLVEINQEFEDEERKTFQINSEMKQQYRAMLKELEEKIGRLDDDLKNGEKDLFEKQRHIKDIIKTKDKEIEEKDNEIRDLRKKIDDMSQEFASMLKATLDKMQERIELANTRWDSDLV